MQLTLTAAPAKKINAKIADDAGRLILSHDFNPQSGAAQKKLALATGLPIPDLLDRIFKLEVWMRGVKPDTVTFEVPGPNNAGQPVKEGMRLYLRGILQRREQGLEFKDGTPIELLTAALKTKDYNEFEPVLDWHDKEELAVADVDYHGWEKQFLPTSDKLIEIVNTIQPRPVAFHVSHGGGLKMYYVARDGLTAEELASVGALAFLWRDGRARIDVQHSSRHPSYKRGNDIGGEVFFSEGTADIAELSRWFKREVDPISVEELLSSHGLKVGQSLEHDKCFIQPSTTAKGTPVYIGKDGIFCHVCAAHGQRHGACRVPGFVPYASLTGSSNSLIARMASSLTHWEHARLVLGDLLHLPEALLKPAYSAILKTFHPNDSRVKKVFVAGKDIVRTNQGWQSVNGSVTYVKDIDNILWNFPAVRDIVMNEEGQLDEVVNKEKVNRFLYPNTDLTEYGYPYLTPVRGARIYGHRLQYPDKRISYLTHPPIYNGENMRYAPKYLSQVKRHENPWGVIEKIFPGVDRNYVMYCIAMKGLAEGMADQTVFTFVRGPTESGKSSMPQLAMSIAGDWAYEVPFKTNGEGFKMAMRDVLDRSSLVIVNEILKEAQAKGLSQIEALDPFLTFNETTAIKRNYLGNMPLGVQPAVICTDTQKPIQAARDGQIGRRFVFVELTEKHPEWNKYMSLYGLKDPLHFRIKSEEHALACDSILSEVIDRFFMGHMRAADIAENLGFTLLKNMPGAERAKEDLLAFAKAVNAAPELTDTAALRRFSPEMGWKLVELNRETPIKEAWDAIADAPYGEAWHTSRAVDENSWNEVTGFTQFPIYMDIEKLREGAIVARMRGGKNPKRPEKVGGWW